MAWLLSSAGMMPSLPAQPLERVERFAIRHWVVLGAPAVLEEGVFGADRRVVQASTDGVRLDHLAVGVLQHVAAHAVQHADLALT